MEKVQDTATLGDYLMSVASGLCAGLGTANFWIGVSVTCGLIVMCKPRRLLKASVESAEKPKENRDANRTARG
jgi:hypothetical protein